MIDREKRIENAQPTKAEPPAAEGARSEPLETPDLVDRIQRLQAEFENYKKRVTRESGEREDRAVDRFLLDVLPLYDGLQLAFENYNRDHDANAFVSGVERIFAQFEQILTGHGVAQIDAHGQVFDPALHEALMSLTSDQERNVIVEVFSPGYVRNGRTLRPSKVGVSQGPALAPEEEE